ncbi:MAG: phenylpyruvate tautomerase MIF-related protein [Eubacteriales bacterium]
MPFIRTTTNQHVTKEIADTVKTACGQAIVLLRGKSENWLMVEIEGDRNLYFQGSDAPCAIAEVQVYGKINDRDCDNMTEALTKILTGALGVPADRVYVRYEEVSHWGWNGSNF